MAKPIGILGGTFDPVHVGHLRMALELHTALDLAEVRFIPIHTHPFGKTLHATTDQRTAMLKLAVTELPQCQVDMRELQRASVSYTVETVISLREEVGPTPICLFLGLDAFRQLADWHRWNELLNYTHVVVVDRTDMTRTMSASEFNPTIATLLKHHAVDSIQPLHDRPAGCILHQSIPVLDISATRIRSMLAAEHSIRYLVPDAVLDYIRKHKLYIPDA